MNLRRVGIGAALVALLAIVASQSFVTIDPDQRGVVERYGRPTRDLLPGFHLKLPLGIESVRRVYASERTMPIGYRLIDEKLGLNPSPRQKEWLTGDNNIVELKATILYSIREPRKYLYGVSSVNDLGPESQTREPRTQDFALRRIADAALTEIVGGLDVESILTEAEKVLSGAARERIQRDVDAIGLGVEIGSVQILGSDPLSTVASAFRRVQDAKADRDRMLSKQLASSREVMSLARRKAEIELQEAESAANDSVVQATARAEVFADLHDAIGDVDSAAGRRLRLQHIKDLLERAKPMFVQPGTESRPTTVPVFVR